jgi:RNA polymerase sigma-70 factor (ECF subfamily)
MRRMAAGDDTALSDLMARWRDRVGAFLVRLTGNPVTALDLTQETFVRVYLSRQRYQPRGSFSTYLFAIAANLARDHARWLKRHPTVPLDVPDVRQAASAASQPDEAAENRDRWNNVSVALAQLPVELREAIVLSVCEGLSHAEIATLSKCSVKAVETRIYRARKLLRTELGGDFFGENPAES